MQYDLISRNIRGSTARLMGHDEGISRFSKKDLDPYHDPNFIKSIRLDHKKDRVYNAVIMTHILFAVADPGGYTPTNFSAPCR